MSPDDQALVDRFLDMMAAEAGASRHTLAAYRNAFLTDPTSAFGGIIAFNREVDGPTAEAVSKQFVEVVIAPAYSTDALAVFESKKNVRLLQIEVAPDLNRLEMKRVGGGLLVQTPDDFDVARMRVVTKRAPTRQEMNDLVFAFPALLIAIMITAVFGPSALNAIIAIGIFNVPVFARLTRAGALTLWPRDFILAARVAGKGATRISLEHILPNLVNLLIVQGTIQFSLGILAEAGLSYVGLGAQPPTPSWGRMLAESQTMIAIAPRLALVPGLAIVLTVLGLNLMGDGLRDLLDPRLRRVRA